MPQSSLCCLTASPATSLLQRCTNQVPRTRSKQMGFVNCPDFQAQGETLAAAGKCPLLVVTTPVGEHGQSAPNSVRWSKQEKTHKGLYWYCYNRMINSLAPQPNRYWSILSRQLLLTIILQGSLPVASFPKAWAAFSKEDSRNSAISRYMGVPWVGQSCTYWYR